MTNKNSAYNNAVHNFVICATSRSNDIPFWHDYAYFMHAYCTSCPCYAEFDSNTNCCWVYDTVRWLR